MYTVIVYYLLDIVSETILGHFEAKSEAMARKILDSFDFDKAKLSIKDCILYKHLTPIHRLETFDEVVNSKFVKDCSDLLHQNVLFSDDIVEKKNG